MSYLSIFLSVVFYFLPLWIFAQEIKQDTSCCAKEIKWVEDPLSKPEIWKQLIENPTNNELWQVYVDKLMVSLSIAELETIGTWKQELMLRQLAGKDCIKGCMNCGDNDFFITNEEYEEIMQQIKFAREIKASLSDTVNKSILCNWLEVSSVFYMAGKIDLPLVNVYQANISLTEWKQKIAQWQAKQDTLSSKIVVDFQVEAKENIKNMFLKEMRFKVENCELLVYDVENQQIKYKKEYICSTWLTTEGKMPIRQFIFDLAEWLPKMQVGNQLIIRFPRVLHKGADENISVVVCESSNFVEKVYKIIE